MKNSVLLSQLKDTYKDTLPLDSVQELERLTVDADFINVLCSMSVESVSHELRTEIIKMLQSNEVDANEWFKDCALKSPKSSCRRWALINLSLMQCKTAKVAVLKGLKDRCRKVRIAAAFNAGLYRDDDVLTALEHYFETERFDFAWDIITDEVKKLIGKRKKNDLREHSEVVRKPRRALPATLINVFISEK
ncbi:MAG: hypothetical protein WAK95_03375 [Desulfobacterales bacterium]